MDHKLDAPFDSRLSPQEPGELRQYRSLSLAAIVALVFGLLSIIALATPYGWWLPVPAIFASIIALVRISRAPESLIGRRIALAGLALALLFGTWGPAFYLTNSLLLNRQARQFVEQWLRATMRGELEAAHQATLEYYLRQPEGTALREYYQATPEKLQELQVFFSQGIVQDLTRCPPDSEIRLDEYMDIDREFGSQYLTHRYFVAPTDPSLETLHIQVDIARDEGPQDRVYWSLIGIADAERIDQMATY